MVPPVRLGTKPLSSRSPLARKQKKKKKRYVAIQYKNLPYAYHVTKFPHYNGQLSKQKFVTFTFSLNVTVI